MPRVQKITPIQFYEKKKGFENVLDKDKYYGFSICDAAASYNCSF